MGFAFACFSLWGLCTISYGTELPDVDKCRNGIEAPDSDSPDILGWCLIIDPARGNCLSCHHVATEKWPGNLAAAGNIGPILDRPPRRLNQRAELVQFLHDATELYPDTSMPPFGKHLILNERELNLIATFLLQTR